MTQAVAADPPTLAEQHALLRSQVAARAEDLLAATAAGRRHGTALAALADYARAAVLSQAGGEEDTLFLRMPAREATRLVRDHVRLRAAADLLTRVAAGEQPMSADRIAAAARDYVSQLERHLRTEEILLARSKARPAPAPVPGLTITPELR